MAILRVLSEKPNDCLVEGTLGSSSNGLAIWKHYCGSCQYPRETEAALSNSIFEAVS